jgi:transglutaminase superfamily protein
MNIRRLSKRSSAELTLLAQAVLLMPILELTARALPFRRVIRLAGPLGSGACDELDPPARAAAERVGWAVGASARRLPCECRCLAQALTARLLLAQRKIPTTLHIGVRRMPEGALDSHAWLCAGDVCVTGAPAHREFQTIAVFGGQPRASDRQSRSSSPVALENPDHL